MPTFGSDGVVAAAPALALAPAPAELLFRLAAVVLVVALAFPPDVGAALVGRPVSSVGAALVAA